MSTRKRNPNIMAELAVAIASRRPVSRWAKEKGIPERTAYMWSSLKEVKEQVKEIRARLTDEAVGRLVSLSGGAVAVIGKLASGTRARPCGCRRPGRSWASWWRSAVMPSSGARSTTSGPCSRPGRKASRERHMLAEIKKLR